MSPLFIGLKYVSLKDVSLKDVNLKDVVVPCFRHHGYSAHFWMHDVPGSYLVNHFCQLKVTLIFANFLEMPKISMKGPECSIP